VARFEEAYLLPVLDLRTPDGGALPVDEATLALRRGEGGEAVEARLRFQVDAARFEEIDRRGLFHLAPEARGPVFAGGFLAEGPPIAIEARLAPALVVSLGASKDVPADEVGARLLGSELATDPFRATECWYALYVTQEREPGLRTGFKTKWAAPPEQETGNRESGTGN
jgi:hypothetical protein